MNLRTFVDDYVLLALVADSIIPQSNAIGGELVVGDFESLQLDAHKYQRWHGDQPQPAAKCTIFGEVDVDISACKDR